MLLLSRTSSGGNLVIEGIQFLLVSVPRFTAGIFCVLTIA